MRRNVQRPGLRHGCDPASAAGKSEYNGETYYFCSSGCKKTFDKNPEKFAGKKEEHAHQGHH